MIGSEAFSPGNLTDEGQKRTNKTESEDYALTARKSALYLNVHITTFRKKVVEGLLPPPFFPPGPPGRRCGGSPR